MWWLYGRPGAPACARSLRCCSRFGSRVNRNVVDRDKGTPVWETSTRLGFSMMASLGTALMVPEATDKAAVTNRHTPSQLGIPHFSGPMSLGAQRALLPHPRDDLPGHAQYGNRCCRTGGH